MMKIKIYEKKEYEDLKMTGKCRLFLFEKDSYQRCHLELRDHEIAGTIIIPNKSDLIHKEDSFGYDLVDNECIFLDHSGVVTHVFEEYEVEESISPEEFLLKFFWKLIDQECEFLQSYEEMMAKTEELLMDYDGENISGQMIRYRKELQKLQSYYLQLSEISNCLEERISAFKKYSEKLTGLISEVRELKEYAFQIRELYQTQISVRQNKIMQMLTIITTLFMPLNLVTGWYGMNFVGMKELDWQFSYPLIILCSIGLISLEIWYLKRKKWFL